MAFRDNRQRFLQQLGQAAATADLIHPKPVVGNVGDSILNHRTGEYLEVEGRTLTSEELR